MLKLLKFLFLIVVAAMGASFAYINPGLVTLSYYFGAVELPLGILIFLLLGIGILLGLLSSIAGYLKLRRENAHLRRRSQLIGEEINNLRSLPLRDR